MLVKQGEMTYDTSIGGIMNPGELNNPEHVQVGPPDLWHIAQALPKQQREMVLACWHMAHAYKCALNKIGRPDIHAEVDVSGMC